MLKTSRSFSEYRIKWISWLGEIHNVAKKFSTLYIKQNIVIFWYNKGDISKYSMKMA